jgi:tRNA-2-methylthio-N6-dimethylallyladenosine synthase
MALKFHLRTYGCQMNERDTEAVAALLTAAGHVPVDGEEEADILLFNTCSVRDQAERKAVGKIGLMARRKRDNPALVIGVLGCMAQRRGRDLLASLPHVDFVLGTDQAHRIAEVVAEVLENRLSQVLTDADPAMLLTLGERSPGARVNAHVAIMRGCNRFCSYCIVPYVRGREKSRPAESIVDEVRGLAAAGVREVLLLGQNVAAYGLEEGASPVPDRSPFADLLARLDGVPGLARIRFTSPHPAYFNVPLIDAVAALPKVCEGIHLPLQSGSDRILGAMNRHYTPAQYREVVDRLKARVPGIAFSTDVIVGFPGETDDDFRATRDLMNEVGFGNAFIFKYSPRSGTRAADLLDDVPLAVKEERNQILLADLKVRTAQGNRAEIGAVREVLVEGTSKRNPQRWCGRTRTNQVVVFSPPPDIAPGDLLAVRISHATAMTLYGEAEDGTRVVG